ncbi:MLP-like protein 43 [Bienertia sinuspersici]
MSLKRKLEGEIEIREGASDAFHDIYKSKPHHISNASPHILQSCELHRGEFGTPGAILTWNYTLGDGKARVCKTEIEKVDGENRLMRQKLIEGDLMDDYKSLVFICHVVPKDKETSIVKWILEYEKVHAGAPEPSALMDCLLALAKDIDDHHHGIKK